MISAKNKLINFKSEIREVIRLGPGIGHTLAEDLGIGEGERTKAIQSSP